MASKSDQEETIVTSFYETPDAIIEQIYDIDRVPEIQFAIYSKSDESISYADEIALDNGAKITPILSLVDKSVILLPSEATTYESEITLIGEITSFIHKNLDIHPFFENVIARYVLMTWVYENLSAVPYLRALGEYGTGKTRFIQTIGSLCYKPMFLAGATSDAYLFRVIELFGGTLVINELERVNTDMQSQITIILNNGYEKGMPVGRVEGDGKKREPKTFDVFCPKLISTRKRFEDQALESRIISVPMRQTTRKDIPSFLGDDFWIAAREIRNKLLMYRFKHLHDSIWHENETRKKEEQLSILEPRLKQTLLPLFYVINDKSLEKEFIDFAIEFQGRLIDVRGQEMTGLIFQKLYELHKTDQGKIAVKDVTEKVNADVEHDRAKLTSHTIGKIIREDLGFKTQRGTGGFYYVSINDTQMKYLVSRYGIASSLTSSSPLPDSDSKEDLVDSVNFTEDIEKKEREAREALTVISKTDPSYPNIYHQWFALREEGEKRGLWGFIPSPNE